MIANGINDCGEIVGWSQVSLTADNSIAQRAFVTESRISADPTPRPAKRLLASVSMV